MQKKKKKVPRDNRETGGLVLDVGKKKKKKGWRKEKQKIGDQDTPIQTR